MLPGEVQRWQGIPGGTLRQAWHQTTVRGKEEQDEGTGLEVPMATFGVGSDPECDGERLS